MGGAEPLGAQSSSCVGALSRLCHTLGYSTSCVPARISSPSTDVYLLDDPLSAVDAHVGRHLFDRCICGLLGKVCTAGCATTIACLLLLRLLDRCICGLQGKVGWLLL